MKSFVQKLLRDGEDACSTIILLETEWPHMEGRTSVAWIEALR